MRLDVLKNQLTLDSIRDLLSRLEIKRESITVKNGTKLFASACLAAFGYYTLKIYLIRRKYAHIPGPETKG